MANEINSVAGQLVGIPVGQVYTAGPGIKIDPVNKVVSVDETVLWDGTQTGSGTINLNESWTNFEYIEMFGYNTEGKLSLYAKFRTADLISVGSGYEVELSSNGFATWINTEFYVFVTVPCRFSPSTPNVVTVLNQRYVGKWNGTWQAGSTGSASVITRIIGVNRISA